MGEALHNYNPRIHKATDNNRNDTYDIRPPKNAKLPPISLIFRWHESNKPDVVLVAGVCGPIMCAGDRSILTRPLRLSIFGNVLIRVYNSVYVIVSLFSLPFLIYINFYWLLNVHVLYDFYIRFQ